MIGYLSGQVLDKHNQEIWVEVAGVGYRVMTSVDVYSKLQLGSWVKLYVHTHVREGAIDLYGFLDRSGLVMFELLLSVSGIGPKTALGITDAGDAGAITRAVQQANIAFFQAVPGIGKKSAQRIIVDLKGKLGQVKELDLADESDDGVVEALVSLGFDRAAVMKVVGELPEGLSEDDKVREGLRKLGRG